MSRNECGKRTLKEPIPSSHGKDFRSSRLHPAPYDGCGCPLCAATACFPDQGKSSWGVNLDGLYDFICMLMWILSFVKSDLIPGGCRPATLGTDLFAATRLKFQKGLGGGLDLVASIVTCCILVSC